MYDRNSVSKPRERCVWAIDNARVVTRQRSTVSSLTVDPGCVHHEDGLAIGRNAAHLHVIEAERLARLKGCRVRSACQQTWRAEHRA